MYQSNAPLRPSHMNDIGMHSSEFGQSQWPGGHFITDTLHTTPTTSSALQSLTPQPLNSQSFNDVSLPMQLTSSIMKRFSLVGIFTFGGKNEFGFTSAGKFQKINIFFRLIRMPRKIIEKEEIRRTGAHIEAQFTTQHMCIGQCE